jgi:hypothetical protein
MSRLTVCERMHESAMVLTPATAASAVSLYYIFRLSNFNYLDKSFEFNVHACICKYQTWELRVLCSIGVAT